MFCAPPQTWKSEEEEEIRRRRGEEKKRDFCFFARALLDLATCMCEIQQVHPHRTLRLQKKDVCPQAHDAVSLPPPCRDIGCGHPVAAIAWEGTSVGASSKVSFQLGTLCLPLCENAVQKNILLSHTECVQTIPFLAFFR